MRPRPAHTALVFGFLTFACGGGGGGGSSPPAKGSLAISIAGLPSGAAADVSVAGPGGFSRHLGAAQTLDDLEPGSYAVNAETVSGYTAAVTGSPATVIASQTASASVTYTAPAPLTTGSLVVSVTGLPAGAAADVTVSGPAAFSHHLTTSQTLTGLAAGSYAVTAASQAQGFSAVVTGSPAAVAASAEAQVSVVYQAPPPSVTPQITFFAIPTGGGGNGAIVAGPDGNLWFTERARGKVGRVTTAGAVTEFPLPHADSDPSDIAAGPDANLWYADTAHNQIGRITPQGVISEFPLTSTCMPFGIARGPGTTVWFTESLCPGTLDQQQRLGSIDTANTASIVERFVPGSTLPFGIALGPDGKPWFAELAAAKIGTSTTAGALDSFACSASPTYVTAASDGNVWFVDGKLGVVTPAGVLTEHATLSSTGGTIARLAADDAGGVWYSVAGGTGKIGRMDATTFANEEFPLSAPGTAIVPSGIAFGPDGAIWVLAQDTAGNASVIRFAR